MAAATRATATPLPARELLACASAEIAAGGAQTPRLDAEILLADVLGVGRERLLSDPTLQVGEGQLERFRRAVARRAHSREPVAYITGRRAFRHLELAVDRRALVPRPETELLVECALALPRGARVLDVGTGSGAVALALAQERADLEVVGSDLSEASLALARENSRRLGLPVGWVRSDLLAGLGDDFDAVLANLPYIAEGESDTLAPEILNHEPPEALFAGSDGLSAIRELTSQLTCRARVRFAALEVGAGQAPVVEQLLRACGFRSLRRERDLAAIERVVVAEGRA
jgi:release factor glutamine methyltransferase